MSQPQFRILKAGGQAAALDNKELSLQRISPFKLLLMLFAGMGVSIAYGLFGWCLLFYFGRGAEAQPFFVAYTSSFKTIVSLGLILGTALITYRFQDLIPNTIESAFTHEQLAKTDYFVNKQKFYSLFRSITFSAEFIVVSFIIFSYSEFPLSSRGQALMIIAGCTQYALGVYVGRKLMYSGMMLNSLHSAPVVRNLFRKRELDPINAYVHVASTLMLIFGYIHVIGYYDGPFKYGSILGTSIKPFLLIPVIIGTPVLLIFNFYPRAVLRKLYSKSIDLQTKRLKRALRNTTLTWWEKRAYIIDFNKMHREELRYSLQLTLSDLPVGITILIMLIQSLMKL